MSYAARLAAMSRANVPAAPPRVVGGDAEPRHEEIVETEAPAPSVAAPATASVTPRQAARAEAVPAKPSAQQPRVAAPDAPPVAHEPAPAIAPITRETIEHHTIVEPAPPQPRRFAAPAQSPLRSAPPVTLPAQAQWLADDTAAADPLVASADGDALRELMRSVRQWTSSAPTVIEQHHHEAEAAPAEILPVVAPPQTQVSIGNITITVDDAPPAATRTTTAAPRTASDRMARNHIRGA